MVIALAILFVLVLILFIVLATKSNTPTPGPSPDPGPKPLPDAVWNPYKLESLYTYDKSRVFGSIQLQDQHLSASQ